MLRKTDKLQSNVESYHSNLAERASDALGNVPVIQSFTRIEAEVRGLRSTITSLLEAQIPVLTWWAVATVATRASATLTVLSIFVVGTWLLMQGLTTVGEIVTFMGFATMLVGRLEQIVAFVNFIFMQAPKMREFFTRIAAVNNVDRITKPLFIVAGQNDPRVPANEGEQMVAAMKKNGRPVWWLMARDEGHGFAKKKNQDFQFYATIAFMQAHLL